MQQPHADVHPPLHPAGESLDLSLGTIGEADNLQHIVHAPLELLAAQAVHLAPESQVCPRTERGVEGHLLRHDANAGLDLHRLFDDRMTRHPRIPGSGCDEAAQHGDGSGFASSIGTQQAENLTLLNLERYPIYRQDVLGLVALDQPLYCHNCVHKLPSFPQYRLTTSHISSHPGRKRRLC